MPPSHNRGGYLYEIHFLKSLLQNEDFRSKSRHAKKFATGIVDIPKIKF
jgi:hypothetical protein